MEKITISRIAHFTKDKDGNALVSKKTGKPYTRCLIDTTDGRKLSGFGSQTTSNWNDGMEVEVEITESNGYLNFSVPKAAPASAINEMAIKTHISQEIAPVKEALRQIVKHFNIEGPKPTVGNTSVEYPDLESSDIPFEDKPF